MREDTQKPNLRTSLAKQESLARENVILSLVAATGDNNLEY